MTCAETRGHLDDWPAVSRQPVWGAVVRHTAACPDCRARLVATVVMAERVRSALQALPGPPEALRRAVLAMPAPGVARAALGRSARARLAAALPHLPLLIRLAADPLVPFARWLPAPSAE